MLVAREVHPRSSDHRGTADPGTAMDENLAASDVVGNRTHDCVELVNWNRLSIINGNVNVMNPTTGVARRTFGKRNDARDAEGVCPSQTLGVKQASKGEPL